MFSSRDAFENDFCPVRDELLGEMYRANEQRPAATGGERFFRVRAMLALFCYRRSHLHSLALVDRRKLQRTRTDPARRPRRLHALRAVPRTGRARPRRRRPTATASRSRCRPSRSRRSRRSRTSSTTKICRSRDGVSRSVVPAKHGAYIRLSLALPTRRSRGMDQRQRRQPVPLPRHVAFGIAGHAGAADLRAARHRSRTTVATPILPDSAEQRSPSQRMPDSLSLTNFSGIRSSAASSSMVKRGQFGE